MRKIVISALIAGAAVAASPAAAQPGRYQNAAQAWRFQGSAYNAMRGEIQQLDSQISRAEQNRRISRREAQGLRRQVINLQRNFAAFSRGGIDRREHATLDGQLRAIRQNLRVERRDADRRRG